MSKSNFTQPNLPVCQYVSSSGWDPGSPRTPINIPPRTGPGLYVGYSSGWGYCLPYGWHHRLLQVVNNLKLPLFSGSSCPPCSQRVILSTLLL